MKTTTLLVLLLCNAAFSYEDTTINTHGWLGELAIEAAQKFNLNTSLLFAVIKQESNWNPQKVSLKGAIGLMQVTPSQCGGGDLKDPAVNLDCGAGILRSLIDSAGDSLNGEGDVEEILRIALTAYHRGLPKTQRYIDAIMNEVRL